MMVGTGHCRAFGWRDCAGVHSGTGAAPHGSHVDDRIRNASGDAQALHGCQDSEVYESICCDESDSRYGVQGNQVHPGTGKAHVVAGRKNDLMRTNQSFLRRQCGFLVSNEFIVSKTTCFVCH